MTIKSLSSGFVLLLGSLLVVAVGLQLRDAWRVHSETALFAASEHIRAGLLDAAALYARERERTLLALELAETKPLAAQRLAALRAQADAALTDGLKRIPEEVPGLVSADEIATVKDRLDDWKALRTDIDTALTQPPGLRDPALPARTMAAVSAVITESQDLRYRMLRVLPIGDRLLAYHGLFKHFAWVAAEFTARQRTILTVALAAERPLTAAQRTTLAGNQGRIDIAWNMIEELGADIDDPAIDAVLARIRENGMASADPLIELLRSGDGTDRRAIDATAWYGSTTAIIQMLRQVQQLSVRRGITHAAALHRQAAWRLLIWGIAGFLTVVCVTAFMLLLRRRVIGPISVLTHAAERLADGDLTVRLPAHQRRDEVGTMIRALEAFRASATERLRLERAKERIEREAAVTVRESEARLRAIFNSVAEGIITVDGGGSILAANPAAGTIFGLSPTDLTGTSIRTLAPDLWTAALEAEAGRRTRIETTGTRADGGGFPLEATVSVAPAGEGRMFIAALRDITDRRAVERMKSEFVSTVSHELRTPLTSIRGSLGILLGGAVGPLPEPSRALVEMAHRNTQRLISLVNDILDISKIEAGKLELSLKHLDLASLVTEAVAANASYAELHGVSLTAEAPSPGPLVAADQDRLIQVLANLISNACKFSDRGGRVTVSLHVTATHAHVAVHDTGPGVPEDFKGRIFQKFAQAESADNRNQGGTGLGLSISKAIIEAHGGRIAFESAPGDTTFRIELPVVRSLPLPERVIATSIPEIATERPRLLVCEDDQDVARLLRLLLEREGYLVDIAHDASSVRAALDRHRYVGLTLDLRLPDQDGIDLLRDLRADARFRSLPVVVISASAGPEQVNGNGLGIVDWLSKPIDEEKLRRALGPAADGERMPRILHLEDDPDLVSLVARIMEGRAVVEGVSTLAQARVAVRARPFDLIILDVGLPDGSGLDLIADLVEIGTVTPVLVFAAQDVPAAISNRIDSILVKSLTTNEQLVRRITGLLRRDVMAASPSSSEM